MDIEYWIGFNIFVVIMLVLDLFVFHKHNHEVKVREALIFSGFWIGLALVFNAGIYYYMGEKAALEFFTGYLIEKSLSVDNLFVFLIIFSFFKVRKEYQHKVLFWGIFGALVFRAIFIFAGIELVEQFSFVFYFLGALLIYAGVKLALEKEGDFEPGNSFTFKILNKVLPLLEDFRQDKFWVKENQKLHFTPLFVVLIMIESTDVVFAMDSIPAILAITQDKFIVYTSNIFAILGLRSLYFALAGVMQLFHYLKFGLAIILSFIGVKILIKDLYHIDTLWALAFVALVLIASIIFSIIKPKKDDELLNKLEEME